MATSDAIAALQQAFPDLALAPLPLVTYLDGRDSDQLWVRVPADRLLEVMAFLRDDPRCQFEQLCDLTCIDYLNFPDADDRYGVIYSLLSISLNHRLWVKCFVNDPNPTVPSMWPLWKGSNWLEREVLDLFGITFTDHPDPRRIMLPDNFTDHPLRKDYPLHGRGERDRLSVVDRDSA